MSKSVFIPPSVLSQPESMDSPVVNHHRLDLREKGERKHLSGVYPEMRQQAPSETHSFSLFRPRLAKTDSIKSGMKDLPSAIIASEVIKGKK